MFRLDNLCSALKNRTRTLQMAGPEDWIHFWEDVARHTFSNMELQCFFFLLSVRLPKTKQVNKRSIKN